MAGKDIEGLFKDHRHELQVYLTRTLRDADLAADLTQETFLRYAEQRRDPAFVVTQVRAYLYRIAHNLALDHRRARRRSPESGMPDDALALIADEAPSPERVADGIDALDRIRAALAELPPRTRQVFTLVRLEGLTYRKAAARLGISDSSVQKHLAVAIKHVMQRLRAP